MFCFCRRVESLEFPSEDSVKPAAVPQLDDAAKTGSAALGAARRVLTGTMGS